MKKMYVVLAGIAVLGATTISTVAVNAATSPQQRPSWLSADGKVDYKKMPDSTQVPYTCWNGKKTTLSGKELKDRTFNHAMPGSAKHTLGMQKSRELAAIAGVASTDSTGAQVFNLDESNPAVEAVMIKYEAKETPQCQ
ncbi:MAG TPA: hypothetical protein VLF43_00495 [Candidatus Saccharimonadales bacterium]|nr:hypothetical protein [Candidatus Saccharimonadales bacterium]